MSDLRTRLHAAAQDPSQPLDVAAVAQRAGARARRRRAGWTAAAIVVVAAAGSTAVVWPRSPSTRHVASTGGANSTTTSTSTSSTTTSTAPPAPVANDIDGDGVADTAAIDWRPTSTSQAAVLVAHLSRLGVQSVQLAASGQPPDATQVPLALVDVNGDGRAEVLAFVNRGASTSFVGMATVVDGRLAVVTYRGDPVALAVGGTVMHQDTLGCGPDRVVHGTWQANGTTATGEVDVLRLTGSTLTLVSKTPRSFAFTGTAADAQRERAAGFDVHCPPLS